MVTLKPARRKIDARERGASAEGGAPVVEIHLIARQSVSIHAVSDFLS
jgi:hypothetical protein